MGTGVISMWASVTTLDWHSGYYTSRALPSQAVERLYCCIFPTPNYVFSISGRWTMDDGRWTIDEGRNMVFVRRPSSVVLPHASHLTPVL